jgi:hypothetical protein
MKEDTVYILLNYMTFSKGLNTKNLKGKLRMSGSQWTGAQEKLTSIDKFNNWHIVWGRLRNYSVYYEQQ